MTRLFTSESVTEGHPDKICDQISDAILDAMLSQDPLARVAVETMVTTGQVHVAGEVTTSAYVDIAGIVRQTIADIGYVSSIQGFYANSCCVNIAIGKQSPYIAHGVDTSLEARAAGRAGTDAHDSFEDQGAGDQGLMFGYANRDTPNLFPAAPAMAHALTFALASDRRSDPDSPFYPDGKAQVTLELDNNGEPMAVDTIVVSTQHVRSISQQALRDYVIRRVVNPVLEQSGIHHGDVTILVNPAGPFVTGGPMGDAGLTGRKIIVDTYGGVGRHGGGAFSGKDPSKVDRSAAYAMRWVAKNIVAAGLAKRAEVQVAYAIGAASPVGFYVDTFGTSSYHDSGIADAVSEVFDLRPAAIIDSLDLLRPIYRETAAYGHFGRGDFPWEQIDRVDELRAALRY
jgi:S-adenosylmethionine synthetase